MAGTLYDSFLVQGTVTAGGTTTHTAVRALEIYDAQVYATATNGGGTVKVTTPGGDLSDAMVCATDTNLVRADTMDSTNKLVAAAGTLSFVGAAAADGVATVHCFVTASGTALS